jgi:hypothetical protein
MTACCGHRFPGESDGSPGNVCLGPYYEPTHKHQARETAHQSPLQHKRRETTVATVWQSSGIWRFNTARTKARPSRPRAGYSFSQRCHPRTYGDTTSVLDGGSAVSFTFRPPNSCVHHVEDWMVF